MKFSFNENSENKTFSTNTYMYINKTAQTQGKLLVKDKSILHYHCRLYNNSIFITMSEPFKQLFLKVKQIPKVFYTSLSCMHLIPYCLDNCTQTGHLVQRYTQHHCNQQRQNHSMCYIMFYSTQLLGKTSSMPMNLTQMQVESKTLTVHLSFSLAPSSHSNSAHIKPWVRLNHNIMVQSQSDISSVYGLQRE